MKTSEKAPVSLPYLITFLAMAFGTYCFGQDTIITRNGLSIIGQVVEVSATEIKYKKAGIADGPMYIEEKSGVDRINYKNGFSDVFPEIKPWQLPVAKVEQRELPAADKKKSMLERRGRSFFYGDTKLSEGQLYHLMLRVNDPELTRQVRSAKRSRALQYIGFAAIPLAGAALLESAITSFRGRSNEAEENAIIGLAGGAALSFGASIYFNINKKIKKAHAVRLYSEKYN